jgi:hypothetical protein
LHSADPVFYGGVDLILYRTVARPTCRHDPLLYENLTTTLHLYRFESPICKPASSQEMLLIGSSLTSEITLYKHIKLLINNILYAIASIEFYNTCVAPLAIRRGHQTL